ADAAAVGRVVAGQGTAADRQRPGVVGDAAALAVIEISGGVIPGQGAAADRQSPAVEDASAPGVQGNEVPPHFAVLDGQPGEGRGDAGIHLEDAAGVVTADRDRGAQAAAVDADRAACAAQLQLPL